MSTKQKEMRITPAALSAVAKSDVENFLVAATPGGIERQEAEEQRKAVASQQLPIDGTSAGRNRNFVGGNTDRELWESLGFNFGDKADDIFVNVTFPAGWKIVPTDHSMWNTIVDDKGRKRAAMFYKGAFYDRNAHVSLTRRFSFGEDYEVQGDSHPVVVKDCGKIIHTAGTTLACRWDKDHIQYEKNHAINRELLEEAKRWLTEEYPYWEDPTAYWD